MLCLVTFKRHIKWNWVQVGCGVLGIGGAAIAVSAAPIALGAVGTWCHLLTGVLQQEYTLQGFLLVELLLVQLLLELRLELVIVHQDINCKTYTIILSDFEPIYLYMSSTFYLFQEMWLQGRHLQYCRVLELPVQYKKTLNFFAFMLREKRPNNNLLYLYSNQFAMKGNV